jgi:AcrR family transcriptional regulator
MATQIDDDAGPRVPLSRERILRTAVALADEGGVEAASMRKIAEELGVVPMALYKHVANKDELLDGMLDVVVEEIDPAASDVDWKTAVRRRILSARRALLRHPWASQVMESRTDPTPTVLGYMDSMIGMFRAGGFSIDLTHHAMHAMGSRLMGFSQELFNDNADAPPEVEAEMYAAMADAYPSIYELVLAITHDDASVVGPGCDDQFEFEFALDLMLDGLEKLRGRPDSPDLPARGRLTVARLIYSSIASLDGFVADEDGNFDWAEPDEEVHTVVNDLVRPVGTFLLGRRMYEVLVAWETMDTTDQPRFIEDFAEIWRAADKIVYSTTLEEVSSAKTRIERVFDPDAVREMKAEAERDISVGGPNLAAQAIEAGVVDEWHLFLTPIVVGGGTRLFPDDAFVELELVDERRFGNGVVHLRYRTRG